MRRCRRTVGLGAELSPVTQVREIEALFFGSPLHLCKAVPLLKVWIDRHDVHPPCLVVTLDPDDPGFIGIRIGAVITGEDDDGGLLAGQIIETMELTVNAREAEAGSLLPRLQFGVERTYRRQHERAYGADRKPVSHGHLLDGCDVLIRLCRAYLKDDPDTRAIPAGP